VEEQDRRSFALLPTVQSMPRRIVAAEPHLEDNATPRDGHRHHVRQRVNQDQRGCQIDHARAGASSIVAQ